LIIHRVLTLSRPSFGFVRVGREGENRKKWRGGRETARKK